jgi:hypothetical protein
LPEQFPVLNSAAVRHTSVPVVSSRWDQYLQVVLSGYWSAMLIFFDTRQWGIPTCHIRSLPMLVTKGKSVYQYRSSREDGAVKTRYQGKLSPQQIQDHHKRKEERALRKQHYHEITSLLDALDAFRAVNEWVVRGWLLVNNNYLRRSEIRRLKHA